MLKWLKEKYLARKFESKLVKDIPNIPILPEKIKYKKDFENIETFNALCDTFLVEYHNAKVRNYYNEKTSKKLSVSHKKTKMQKVNSFLTSII